jgi:RHS repeat-associated protein
MTLWPRFAWAQPPVELLVNPTTNPDTVHSPTGLSTTFQVILLNAPTSSEAQLTLSCSGVVTGCTFPNGAGSVKDTTLVPGQTNVTANFAISAIGSGSITLTVFATAFALTNSGTATVVYHPSPGVTVSPKGGTVTLSVNSQHDTTYFTVKNIETATDTVLMTCVDSLPVTSCTTTPQLGLTAGQQVQVGVAYATTQQDGTVPLVLHAKMKHTLSIDTGYVTVTVKERYRTVRIMAAAGVQTVKPSVAFSTPFTVTNTGNFTDTISLAATCLGAAVTGTCSVSPTSVTLAAGASAPATLSTTAASTVGNTGTVRVAAALSSASTIRDSAATDITVKTNRGVGVEIASINNESYQSPDLCLTDAIERGVAYNCGNLRIAHALPSVKTYNKGRTPTLLYNSQLAHPHPVVNALITFPASDGTPDSVVGVIKDGSGKAIGGPVLWPGTQFANGATTQVSIGFDAQAPNNVTNDYSWTFQATASYGTTNVSYTTGAFYAMVNASTHLGNGWTVAGIESMHIYSCGCSMTWSAGDGSAAFYSAVSGHPNLFVPTSGPLTRPDTIKSDDSTGHLRYVRYAEHGVHVIFDSTGHHIQTRDRLGHVTTFAYVNGTDISTITLPTPTGTGLVYRFAYDANTHYLDTVIAPQTSVQGGTAQPRKVLVSINTSGDVASITDPGSTVQFGYGATPNVITSYTDRRGTLTTFTYDAAQELASATVDAISGGLNIKTTYAGAHASTLTTPMIPDSVSTTITGPRTDVTQVTRLWLDRFGGPVRIRDALGYEIDLAFTNDTFPALATRERRPNGQVFGATYDGRGNLKTETDSTVVNGSGFATHSYRWDQTWDLVTLFDPPLHDSLTIVLDPSTGNETSTIDATGAQVTFAYDPAILLVNSVTLPGTPASPIRYDALGNLAGVKSPNGYWTLYQADSVGRDTTVITAYSALDTTFMVTTSYARVKRSVGFDAMSRVVGDTTVGVNGPTAIVTNTYAPDDRVLTVTRLSSPDPANIGAVITTYTYDNLGRTKTVKQPGDTVEQFVYDSAGNVEQDITPRGFTIKTTYDADNRRMMRIIPQAPYTSWRLGIAALNTGNIQSEGDTAYGNITVPADTQTFAYDEGSNIIEGDNSMARVSRTYLPSGLLVSETQRVRTLVPLTKLGDFDEHAYTVRYAYDADSRRTQLTHPAAFTQVVNGVSNDTLSTSGYTYNPQTGRIQSVSDPFGTTNSFFFTPRGDLYGIANGPLFTSRTFDPDGNILTDSLEPVLGAPPVYRAAQFSYDAQDRKVFSSNAYGMRDQLSAGYDGLGNLRVDGVQLHTFDIAGDSVAVTTSEQFTPDAFGHTAADNITISEDNYVTGMSGSSTGHTYSYGNANGFGKLKSFLTSAYSSTDSIWYDPAGNVQFKWQTVPGSTLPTLTDRASFYSADETVRFTDYRTLSNPQGSGNFTFTVTSEEYRYDVFGRRVLAHAHTTCLINVQDTFFCPRNVVQRFVWDGNQELDEVMVQDSIAEQDSAHVELPLLAGAGINYDTNPFYGRVLYTHAVGVDEPLSVVRVDYADRTIVSNGTIIDTNYVLYPPIPEFVYWNAYGRNDTPYLSCILISNSNGPPTQRCARATAQLGFQAYAVLPPITYAAWQGSLLELKQNQDQTFYRRNRVYDPSTGQFTQEDPIGLAGGLNAYGFAAGDPVNYSDPMGLCVEDFCIVEVFTVVSTVAMLYEAWAHRNDFPLQHATPRANRRSAMRQYGVPTSRAASSQMNPCDPNTGKKGGNRQYQYDDAPQRGGGKADQVVTQHGADDKHPDPHWEAGTAKPGDANNPPPTDPLGRRTYYNQNPGVTPPQDAIPKGKCPNNP